VFHGRATRTGRRTSSPPQFGQTKVEPREHAGQNVHSNEQMNASSPGASGVEHVSHWSRISNAIPVQF
jgi:hypothetical protein